MNTSAKAGLLSQIDSFFGHGALFRMIHPFLVTLSGP